MSSKPNLDEVVSVPRRRACAVVINRDAVLMVELMDPNSAISRVFPPGGGIESGETPEACAEREAFEETGYRVSAIEQLKVIEARYDFEWAGVRYACLTSFVPCRLDDDSLAPSPVSDVDFNLGTVWVPIEEIQKSSGVLSYNVVIRDAVLECCRTLRGMT